MTIDSDSKDSRAEPPPVSPYLTVDDGHAAIDFYVRAFGAKLVDKQTTPDGKKIVHAALLVNGGLFMISDDFPEMSGGKSRTPKAFGGSPVTIHLEVPDVDAVWANATEAGARVAMPLADQFWGDRYGKLVDPFGHGWSLATRKRAVTDGERRAASEALFGKS
jgi:PhnB protein